MTSFDSDETFNILLGVTGSVATIKAQQVVQALQEVGLKRGRRVVVKVITTERAKHFLTRTERSETFPEINDGTQIARKNETPRNDEEEQEGSESPLEEDVEVLEGCEETEDLSDNGQDSRVQDHAVSGEEKVTDEVRPDYAAVEDAPDRILKSIYDVEEFAEVIDDSKEWTWSSRGDPVLHIDLCKWADVFVIAPLDCLTLSKIANGACDNLLSCVAMAWHLGEKPMVLCPSMNPWMWKNPATRLNLLKIKAFGTSIEIIPPIAKKVICGDFGVGAMEEPTEIARKVKEIISEKERGFGLLTVVSTGLMLVIFGNLGRALYRILRH